MYAVQFDVNFTKSYKKVIKGNAVLEKKFIKSIKLLAQNPKHPSLNSHKVDIIDQSEVWSSWVTGDVRLIWIYDQDKKSIIICLKVGTHSGANKVYK
jgi:mRNA-degrading endonuclease YafQ of YafQ-DinJ toxin-antitoxin module